MELFSGFRVFLASSLQELGLDGTAAQWKAMSVRACLRVCERSYPSTQSPPPSSHQHNNHNIKDIQRSRDEEADKDFRASDQESESEPDDSQASDRDEDLEAGRWRGLCKMRERLERAMFELLLTLRLHFRVRVSDLVF